MIETLPHQFCFKRLIFRFIPQIMEFIRIRLMVIQLSELFSMVNYQLISPIIIHCRINVFMSSSQAVIKLTVNCVFEMMGIRLSCQYTIKTLSLHKIRDFQSGSFHQCRGDIYEFHQRVAP